MSPDDLERDITGWLVRRGLTDEDEGELLDGFCSRLLAGGVPLMRAAVGTDLLHPVFDARGWSWRRSQGVRKEEFYRQDIPDGEDEEWQRSPFHYLLEAANTDELRRPLDGSYQRGEFPLLDRLQDEGATDYIGFAVGFREHVQRQRGLMGLLCSFQVDRAGGFLDEEVDLLRRLVPVFALGYRSIIGLQTVRTLAATYLGEDAGRRVLDGAIARGQTETVRAVLWYSDLEGFTRIADTAPGDALIALLNDYAEAIVGAVHAHGGQVLKFIGDGILAMFPLRDDAMPCMRALDAAAQVLAEVERIGAERTARGELAAGVHMALHVGDVLYGNIGSRERLDFTVVGPAVNEVARIEAICRSIEQRVIVSSAFAHESPAARHRLVSLGRYALKGVRRPEELFTLDPEA